MILDCGDSGYTGGVLFCGEFCDATFERCNFHHNRAFDAGVAYLKKMSAASFNLCVFTQNYARNDGGVILMEAYGRVIFQDCNVSNNTAQYVSYIMVVVVPYI